MGGLIAGVCLTILLTILIINVDFPDIDSKKYNAAYAKCESFFKKDVEITNGIKSMCDYYANELSVVPKTAR